MVKKKYDIDTDKFTCQNKDCANDAGDSSWVPVGDNSTNDDKSRFTGIFEGNGNIITNLWVNVTSSSGDAYVGLFGVTGGIATIRNVGIISGSIHSAASRNDDNNSGGLFNYLVSR